MASRIKSGGWRKKQSDLAYTTGLMSTKLGGLMIVDKEGLTYIIVVRKSITFYIWRVERDQWAVSAYELDFYNNTVFSKAGHITVFMLDFKL